MVGWRGTQAKPCKAHAWSGTFYCSVDKEDLAQDRFEAGSLKGNCILDFIFQCRRWGDWLFTVTLEYCFDRTVFGEVSSEYEIF